MSTVRATDEQLVTAGEEGALANGPRRGGSGPDDGGESRAAVVGARDLRNQLRRAHVDAARIADREHIGDASLWSEDRPGRARVARTEKDSVVGRAGRDVCGRV